MIESSKIENMIILHNSNFIGTVVPFILYWDNVKEPLKTVWHMYKKKKKKNPKDTPHS